MSETKEATYKSLLQRMVHMTEQRDFDEDLMKEVYGALLPPRKFEAANEKVSRLTAERDDLSRKLAVAEGELKRAERIASMDSSRLVDERIRRIAELERQVAEAKQAHSCANNSPIPSSGPADEGWVQKAWHEYYCDCKTASPRTNFFTALRAHAPAARYPEVVEFLDAVGDGSFIIHRLPNTRCWAAGWSNGTHIESGWLDTLAAACRAALDSRKERSDG